MTVQELIDQLQRLIKIGMLESETLIFVGDVEDNDSELYGELERMIIANRVLYLKPK